MADLPHRAPYRYQVMGGSSNDITSQTLLWRYMTFEKFCWLIEKSALYHARLDQFDDPFEGAVTNEYARMRDSGEIAPQFGRKEHEPWIFESLRFRQYATCWYASEHESDALWRLYAFGGAGIAVVSTIARIQQSVDLRPYVHGILGPVEYVDFEKSDMTRSVGARTTIRPGHLKRKSFAHEREVRGLVIKDLIVERGNLTLDEALLEKQRTEQPLGITAKVNLEELVQSIVISPLAKPFVEELVQIVTMRHNLGHLVRESDLLKTPRY